MRKNPQLQKIKAVVEQCEFDHKQVLSL